MTKDKLLVITCHFNPCGYRAPVRNYWRFRNNLQFWEDHGLINVRTAEIIFDDQDCLLLDDEDSLKIHCTLEKHCLWQKEALLNLLVEKYAAEYPAVAWVDADVLFLSPSWVEDARELLRPGSPHEVVQLFSTAYTCDKKHEISPKAYPSAAQSRHLGRSDWHDFTVTHPGLAWAARSDWLLRHKLLDLTGAGAADSTMALVLGGAPDMARAMSHEVLRPDLWAGAEDIRDVPGGIVHLYHGSNAKRRRRAQRELQRTIHPHSDICRESSGALRWSDDASPDLVKAVREWFFSRHEDD